MVRTCTDTRTGAGSALQGRRRDLVSSLTFAPCVCPSARMSSVSVHNKELKHILSAWHDLLHEHEGQAVMDNAVEWIDEKIRVRELRDSLD